MSQLGNILQQVAKKSSNPNALIYKVQLSRANQKYLAPQQEITTISLAQPDSAKLSPPNETNLKSVTESEIDASHPGVGDVGESVKGLKMEDLDTPDKPGTSGRETGKTSAGEERN